MESLPYIYLTSNAEDMNIYSKAIIAAGAVAVIAGISIDACTSLSSLGYIAILSAIVADGYYAPIR